MKLIMAMQHDTIPAHLHFKELNDFIQLKDGVLIAPQSSMAWPDKFKQADERRPIKQTGRSGGLVWGHWGYQHQAGERHATVLPNPGVPERKPNRKTEQFGVRSACVSKAL